MMRAQIAVLAYNDVFLITAGLSLIMTVAALLMSGVKPKASGGAASRPGPRHPPARVRVLTLAGCLPALWACTGRPGLSSAGGASGAVLEGPLPRRYRHQHIY